MLTANNWLSSNISERLMNKNSNFEITITPTEFNSISLNDAIGRVIEQLPNSPLYLGFSGGMDSSFVFDILIRNAVQFTPVIVIAGKSNKYEVSHAFYECRSKNITPIIIEMTEKEYITAYVDQIFKKLNGVGINSIPSYMAGKYVKENNGILIVGDHMIRSYDRVNGIMAGMYEWDFYNDALISNDTTLPFFLYTAQIAEAMLNAARAYTVPQSMLTYMDNNPNDDVKEREWKVLNDFKAGIYSVPFRPKYSYEFGPAFKRVATSLEFLRDSKPQWDQGFTLDTAIGRLKI